MHCVYAGEDLWIGIQAVRIGGTSGGVYVCPSQQILMLEQKASGKTIFLTTHNMQEAGLLCDNILLLDNGKIVEQGKPEKLCRKYNAENQIAVVFKGRIPCSAAQWQRKRGKTFGVDVRG